MRFEYKLCDSLVGDNNVKKSIQSWISDNPDYIWDSLYNSGTKLSLSKAAHNHLMTVMSKHNPQKYESIALKKKKFIAKRNVLLGLKAVA